MKKIYVKYCGGCNPEYDRTGTVEGFGRCHGFEITTDASEKVDLRLAVSGCRRRCAHANAGPGCHDICCSKDLDDWITERK